MRRLLAGGVAVTVAGAAVLGSGIAAADVETQTDTETMYVLGGAKFPGIPWYEYADRTGRGWHPDANRVLIDYPAGIVEGPSGPGVGTSTVAGTDRLDAAIRNTTSGPEVVTSLSQGALVLDAEQARLANDPTAPPPDQLSFTTFGSPIGSHGFGQSFLAKMFPAGTFLPVIDYTTTEPTESQYDSTVVVTEYDAIADFPDRPENLVSLANALVAAAHFHTPAAFTDRADVPPQNIRTMTNSRGGTTTTYLVPTNQLPLTMPLRDLGMSDQMADEIGWTLQPMVDAGYARNDNALSRPVGVDPVSGVAPIRDVNPAAALELDPVVQADVDALVADIQGLLPPG